jgi:hypothetical protein
MLSSKIARDQMTPQASGSDARGVPHHRTFGLKPSAAESRLALAYHGAGHAIIQRMLMGKRIGGATIISNNDLAGAAWSEGADPKTLSGKQDSEDTKQTCAVVATITPELGESRIECGFGQWLALATAETIIALAGPMAEEIAVGNYSVKGATFDTVKSVTFAKSVTYADEDPEVVDQFLKYCRAEAEALLVRFWACVAEISRLLLEHGTLNGEQIDNAIIEAREKAARVDRAALREYQRLFSNR